MNKKKQLVVFGEDWGRFPSSTQHIIIALLKLGWEVIWIDSIGMRTPSFNRRYIGRLINKLYNFFLGQTKKYKALLPDKLTVIHPMIIPFIGYPVIDKINRIILKKQLECALKRNQFSHPLLWATLPTAYPYLKLFKDSRVIYYCCDNYLELDGVSRSKVKDLEAKIVDAASLIIVTSKALAQKMPASKSYFLDHGVNLALFQKQYPRPHDLPQGKPVAGFYGSLSSWVDVDLIFHCATRLPHWNFVLIGPKTIDLSKLDSLSNVCYLGCKPYDELPAYPQHWDVSLLPFLNNAWTQAVNSIKLKEYLATGKAIVAVDLPTVQPYKQYIYIAHDQDDFIRSIELAQNDHEDQRRQKSVQHESWDSRAVMLDKQLMAL